MCETYSKATLDYSIPSSASTQSGEGIAPIKNLEPNHLTVHQSQVEELHVV